ncbi:hypothetical protein RB195_020353 [Necator americanus]|uniref:Uncharacterized protein n=1 Tax=Necator americanus TaxID=51031 RepID=A0ABR1CIG0_NECAM
MGRLGVKIDGRQPHHVRKLIEFDETCGCIGLQLYLKNMMFMRIGLRCRPNPGVGQEETNGLKAYKSIEDLEETRPRTPGSLVLSSTTPWCFLL